jgi:glucose/arabinose dehydrogenase
MNFLKTVRVCHDTICKQWDILKHLSSDDSMRFIFWLGTALLLTGIFVDVHAQDVVPERVYPDITISNPVDLQHANDGSGRLFVVSQSGIIYVLGDDQSVTTPPVFLDISSQVLAGGERGLLGLAFHPGYAENGFFYVYYTAGTNFQLRSVISRFSVHADNPGLGNPDSEFVLLEFDQPYSNHNAGQIAFGPEDGYLYIATGDGGSGGDPENNAQDRSTLPGNILRIDVDNPPDGMNYAIPAGNPFADNTDGYREEIYAWGFRNPWRMSFDPETGWLWAADVGQAGREEINIVISGGNYGWKIMEGSDCFSPPTECDRTGLILPVWEYTHDSGAGRSITGGYVYRGTGYPELQGKYFYSDYVSANMWMLDYDGISEPVNTLLPNPGFSIASFGTDQDGELYALGHQNGEIYRIIIAGAVPLPGTPVLISPDDGATGRPLEFFFAWQAADDAETYRLQIAADQEFEAIEFDIQNITATSLQAGEFEYGTMYHWRVRANNETGAGDWSETWNFTTSTTTSTGGGYNEFPVGFELEQNFPNPFNPSTSIRLGIPAGGGAARLEVFDLMGRKVATLVDQTLPAGWQTVTFNAEKLNSGIYIYRLEAAGQTIVKKMMLVK